MNIMNIMNTTNTTNISMECFLNRLDIYFYNIVLAKTLDDKSKSFNKLINLLKYCKMTLDFVDYVYSRDKTLLTNIIDTLNKPSLIMLSYDLDAIGKAIGIPENSKIVYYTGSFHIEYSSPTLSSTSSCEWS